LLVAITSSLLLVASLVVLFNSFLINQSKPDLARTPPGLLTDWLVYENSKYKIKVKYPKTWNYQLKDNAWGESFVIFRPLDHQQSGAKIAISVESMRDLISLKEYTENFKEIILKDNEECKLIEQKDSYLLHNKAYTVVYEFKDNNKKVRKMAILSLKHKKGYIVYYEAELYSFSKIEPVVQIFVDSLEITNY